MTAEERLIRAAAPLFHGRGYSAVGVQELCEQSDVRRGSFYYHFPSKEALAIAVLHHEEKELLRKVFDPAFLTRLPPLERFDSFLNLLHHYHVERSQTEPGIVGGCPIAHLGREIVSWAHYQPDLVEQIFDRFTERFRSALADAKATGDLPKDVDVARSGLRIRAYVLGLQEMARLSRDADVLLELGINVPGLCYREVD